MKKKKIRYGAVAATILLVLYIPSFLSWIMDNNIKTAIIHKGNLVEYIPAEAWLIRDEELLYSEADGKCIRNAAEGDLVPVNYAVTTVFSESVNPLLEQLASIDNEILQIKKTDEVYQSIFAADVMKTNSELSELMKRFVDALNKRDMAACSTLKIKMDNILRKKTETYGSFSNNTPEIAELEARRDSINAQLVNMTIENCTDKAGIISYTKDSLEEYFKIEEIDNLNLEMIEEAETAYYPEKIPSGSAIKGMPYARLAKGLDYYMAAVIKNEKAALLEKERYYDVKLNGLDIKISAEVYSIKRNADGTSLVILKTSKAMSETASLRKISIDIILGDYTGLKVPLASLVDFDKDTRKARIALVSAYKIRFADVLVEGFNNEYAIINNDDNITDENRERVYLYSIYITDPRNLTEGQEVN